MKKPITFITENIEKKELEQIERIWKMEEEKRNVKEEIEKQISIIFPDKIEDSSELYIKPISEISKISGIEMTRLHSFIQWEKKMMITFILKNMAYKDSYKKHGIIGMIIRISDKIDRLFNMEIKGIKESFIYENDESKLDTFIDIAVYCILSLIELKDRNE
jgi:hypothetical protein